MCPRLGNGGKCWLINQEPEIPLLPPNVVVRVGVDGLALVVESATNVVWMDVGDDDCVDLHTVFA
jgi:hypothetical protein